MNRQRGFVVFAIAAAVVLLAALALAAWYLINIPERSLDPGITASLQHRHDQMPPQENLFFALLALDSTSERNVNEQGQALYAAYLARRTADPKSNITFDTALPMARQAFAGDRTALCGGRAKPEDCVERALAHPLELRKLIADNRLFLDRYDSLAGYSRLQNPIQLTPSSPLASWSPFMVGKRLFLTQIALEVGAGHVTEVHRLSADIAFTRRLLAQPDILIIDKMILAASLTDSLGVASDLVRAGLLGDREYAQLSAPLTPLTEDERSLVGPMAREFDAFATTIRDLKDPKSGPGFLSSSPSTAAAAAGELSQHFLKYNPTLNAQWRVLTEQNALSRSSCTSFLSGAAAAKHHSEAGRWDRIYNPVGNILSSIAAPAFIEYMHSMCDLDGMIRIVQLQLQARLQHVSDDQLPQFAASEGVRFANPFTSMPMQFAPANRGISFEPVLPRDQHLFPWPLSASAHVSLPHQFRSTGGK